MLNSRAFAVAAPPSDGRGILTDEQVVTRGRRQAEIVHTLLEFYSVTDVGRESGFGKAEIIGPNNAYLALRPEGEMVNPR